jgi:hypothetical protein
VNLGLPADKLVGNRIPEMTMKLPPSGSTKIGVPAERVVRLGRKVELLGNG